MHLQLERWTALMKQFGLSDCAQTFHGLVRVYTAPDRHYHNDEHIAALLTLFDGVADDLRHPEEVELAIWFHDHVYAPVAKDNERRSADGALNFLLGQEIDEAIARRVHALILATDHQHSIKTRDMGYIADIDLAILGAPSDEYQAYEEALTQEFRLIPEFVFHTRRGAFLRGLLERDHIYYTDSFRQRFEETARANIATSIDNLTV